MNTLKQLANDYNQILASLPNSAHLQNDMTQLVSLAIVSQEHHDEASVWEAIREFQPQQGWLTRQSRNDWFTEPGLPLVSEAANVLIHGEMVNGDASLHIRLRKGRWQLSYYQENTPDAEPLLVIKRSLLSTLQSPAKLGYRVYFRHDALQEQGAAGLREFCARFSGWEN